MRKVKTVAAAYAAATVLLAAAVLAASGVFAQVQQQKSGDAWSNADVALKQPSVIPHPIYPTPCATCHKPRPAAATGGAAKASPVGIPTIPHKPYPNCLQCHVPAGDADAPPFRANTFGKQRVAPGGKKPETPPKPKPGG